MAAKYSEYTPRLSTSTGSEAYDLSLFEEKPAKLVALKPSKKAQQKARRRSRLQTFLNAVAVVAVASAVIYVVGMMVYSRVQINEICDQITRQQKVLTELQGETVWLSNQLQAGTSVKKIDEYAAEQNMYKLDPSQIVYISTYSGDKVEVIEDSPSILDKIGEAIINFFQQFA